MVYIVAETHGLAAPLIEALSLKRTGRVKKLNAFASEAALLVESRGSKVAAAAVVGYVLGRCGFDEATRLFHIGRCRAQSQPGRPQPPVEGEPAAEGLAGRIALVNAVRDAETGRGYYPDILLAHEFPEIGVLTCLDAGHRAPVGRAGYVDSELAGFLSAALAFLSPHQVYCLEAVAPPAGDGGRTIVAASVEAIRLMIEESTALVRPARRSLSEDARRGVEDIGVAMRLTAAQNARLVRIAEDAAVRGLDVGSILESWKGRAAVHSKQERSKRFEELTRDLEE